VARQQSLLKETVEEHAAGRRRAAIKAKYQLVEISVQVRRNTRFRLVANLCRADLSPAGFHQKFFSRILLHMTCNSSRLKQTCWAASQSDGRYRQSSHEGHLGQARSERSHQLRLLWSFPLSPPTTACDGRPGLFAMHAAYPSSRQCSWIKPVEPRFGVREEFPQCVFPWLQALTERRDRATSRHQIAGVDIGADALTRKPRWRASLISIESATFIGKLHIRFGLAPSITESVRPSIV
jgi:hypothetical protein